MRDQRRLVRELGEDVGLSKLDRLNCHFPSNTFRCRLLLLTFKESDIFVRATGVNHDAGKFPTLCSLTGRLIE